MQSFDVLNIKWLTELQASEGNQSCRLDNLPVGAVYVNTAWPIQLQLVKLLCGGKFEWDVWKTRLKSESRSSFNNNMQNVMTRYLQISSGPRMSYSHLNHPWEKNWPPWLLTVSSRWPKWSQPAVNEPCLRPWLSCDLAVTEPWSYWRCCDWAVTSPWLSCDLASRDWAVTSPNRDWAVIIGPRSRDHRGHGELTVAIYFLMGIPNIPTKFVESSPWDFCYRPSWKFKLLVNSLWLSCWIDLRSSI